ncbi:MAG: hypothetical protein NTW21_05470 [Verrucomicrobia bacterium]|nr:hypothetical protein [Verrucomicrobiota bacterium]
MTDETFPRHLRSDFQRAALLGWREKQQFSSEKEANDKLVKEVAANPSDDAQTPKAASIRMDRRKEDLAMKAMVKTFASDIFALRRDYPEDPSWESGEKFRKMQANIKSRLEELDPSAIKLFMDECYNNPDLNLRIKRDLNFYVRTVFISKYPFEMARMMSKSPELFGINDKAMPEGYIQDPFKHLVYYYSYERKDIQLVFQCLAESSPESQSKYISGALEFYTDSPPQRTELLEEMRAFASTPEQVELVKRELSELVFGRSDAKPTFIEVSDWLESANLSSDELVGATKDMQEKVRVGETAQWLDWLARTEIPDEVSKERAFELATQWTEKDYQAVGKWLNSSPDSPEKTAVACAYAAKAYPYDPEGAMQWIQTLPQGTDRSKALETIYQGMPKDSDAAKAFASDFGLRK